MSFDGRSEMQAKLKADPAVTALVGTYLSKPAIYSVPLTPEKYTGDAISMYLSAPTDGGLEYGSYRNTVNCWTTDYSKSENLQAAVFDSLNRSLEGSDTFFVCSKLQVIPPQQLGGDYNAPVEVLVRTR
jgi:hypothetical protein